MADNRSFKGYRLPWRRVENRGQDAAHVHHVVSANHVHIGSFLDADVAEWVAEKANSSDA